MLKNVYGIPVVIAINKFSNDNIDELCTLKDIFVKNDVSCEICSSWEDGSNGAEHLAKDVIKKANEKYKLTYSYDMNLPVIEKVKNIIHNVYKIKHIEFDSENIKQKLCALDNLTYFYICIAKTPFSVSSDSSMLGNVTDKFVIKITDIDVLYGAKMIRIHCGNTYLMPGLP